MRAMRLPETIFVLKFWVVVTQPFQSSYCEIWRAGFTCWQTSRTGDDAFGILQSLPCIGLMLPPTDQ